MMVVAEVRHHRTYKQVRINDIDGETDQQVLDTAMNSAGESRARLHGWTVSYFNDNTEAVVDLHTD